MFISDEYYGSMSANELCSNVGIPILKNLT